MPNNKKAPQFDFDDPAIYINRELSLLEFQRRVLNEALNENNPLLERIKFLAIVANNLDEFFMVRVAGLRHQAEAGILDLPPDGMTPTEQLAEIRKTAWRLMIDLRECLHNELMPLLKQTDIYVLDYRELTDKQLQNAKNYFQDVIFPVLTPLAFDPGRPFPHISNLSLNLAVLIRDQHNKQHFARLKVPSSIPRLLPLKRSSGSVRKDGTVPRSHYFVWVEQVIAANLDALFPGMEIIESHPFRVTRDADMDIQELEADDLLETMEQTVRQRRFGSVVRVTVNDEMPTHIRDILAHNLGLGHNDIYTLSGPLGLSDLMTLPTTIDRYELKDPPFVPAIPHSLNTPQRDRDIFAAIRREDILLYHPYDSFAPVVNFLQQAAHDPDVLAIKQTLYRVGRNSPIVQALLDARENGKQVAVLVELKARFDEESNIEWARKLEREGVHVIYGLLGLKTHAKIALVIRKEGNGLRRYIHMATGNYNAVTANLYTDLGMFTCDPDIGADATDLFNYLTGYSAKQDYRKLLVAPINLRTNLIARIEREIEHHKHGKNGHLIFKMNSLVDKRMIKLLYQTSQAGVKIDLLVRGICCLRPGIPGLSDNIRVTSIVGRFLEHSRIYYFHNGGNEETYLGSADLMPRNLNNRVETVFPIEDKRLVRLIRDTILEIHLTDTAKAHYLLPDGSYKSVKPKRDKTPLNSQLWFIENRLEQPTN